jgi:hypothetical protein
MLRFTEDIEITSNVFLCMRERGKLVPGSHREGHNVFTSTGRSILSRLIAWQTIGTPDVPYTHKRMRWMAVGSGTQLEAVNVSSLKSPLPVLGSSYLSEIQSIEFLDSTSVRFIKSFGTSEVTFSSTPVPITEAGIFADVNPATMGGIEDSAVGGGYNSTLSPVVSTYPPSAYKAFEVLTKTQDFTLEIQWDFRF